MLFDLLIINYGYKKENLAQCIGLLENISFTDTATKEEILTMVVAFSNATDELRDLIDILIKVLDKDAFRDFINSTYTITIDDTERSVLSYILFGIDNIASLDDLDDRAAILKSILEKQKEKNIEYISLTENIQRNCQFNIDKIRISLGNMPLEQALETIRRKVGLKTNMLELRSLVKEIK